MNLLILIWVFTPAGIANMAPVISNNIPVLRRFTQPLDGGKNFRGKRLLGKNKTVRGLFAGIIGGLLTSCLQVIVYWLTSWPSPNVSPVDYGSVSSLLFGAFLGLGAIGGDAIESFFKRQFNKKPGDNWFPFDQIDFIIGAMLISTIFFRLTLTEYLAVLIVAIILHPTVNFISWLLKFQDKPF